MQLSPLEADASRESGYILVVEQNSISTEVRTLYHEGLMIESTIVTTSPSPERRKTIVSTTYDRTGKELMRTRLVYDGLQPINLTQTDENGSRLSFYMYEKGKLLAQREIQPGNQERLIVYYRNPRDGSLIGVRVSDPSGPASVRYYNVVEGIEVFAVGDETDFIISKTLRDGVVVRETWVAGDALQTAQVDYDESGNLIVDQTTPDGLVRSTYDHSGLLLHEDWLSGASNGMEITYSYDAQGSLVFLRKLIPGPNQRIIEQTYVDGVIKSTHEWENDLLVKTIGYLPQGTTMVTLYDKGKPYADVTYAPDGKRVLSLTYREGR